MRQEQQSKGRGVGVNESNGQKREILMNVLGGLVVLGVLFLGFAPDSVWQGGGVSPVAERKAGGDLAATDLDGKPWRLGEHRGKVVLVNYWATWCPPCRAETPGLVSLANEHKSNGLEVVGISLDEDIGAIRPFVDEYEVPYPILLPADRTTLSLVAEVLPTTVLYDRQGRMAKLYTGAVSESVFKADVEILLREQ